MIREEEVKFWLYPLLRYGQWEAFTHLACAVSPLFFIYSLYITYMAFPNRYMSKSPSTKTGYSLTSSGYFTLRPVSCQR